MLKSVRNALTVAAATLALAGLATSALADQTQWQKDHPRRTEVNKRLANQNKRINNQVNLPIQRNDHDHTSSCTTSVSRCFLCRRCGGQS